MLGRLGEIKGKEMGPMLPPPNFKLKSVIVARFGTQQNFGRSVGLSPTMITRIVRGYETLSRVLPASLYSGKKFAGGEAGRQTFPSPPGCGAVGSV